MGVNYNREIGYESLLSDFKRYQKQTPKGVSLRRNKNTINLKFKVGNNDAKNNPYRLIYIGDETNTGTTVKTGKRLASPMIPPKYSNLYTDWNLEIHKLPDNKPKEGSSDKTIASFHGNHVAG